MGTTLTGTKPKDTYDSLIKVEDNGPISGTAKYLSDGLGNNLPIAVSTTNVGIGTSTPTAGYKLDLRGRAITYNSGYLADFVSTDSNASSIQVYTDNTQASIVQGGTAAVPLTFFVGGSEKMRIQAGGGISFNGDTAAANALDDYEEGTWTPVDSSGGGLTFLQAVGSYTKIGREVFVRGFIQYPTTADVNNAVFGGLPFTSTGSLAGRGGNVTYVDKTTMSYLITNTAATTMSAFNSAGVGTTNVNLSDAYIYFSANYNV